MAVAEKMVAETSPSAARVGNPGVSFLLGGGILLLALWWVLGAVPSLWIDIFQVLESNPFLSGALLLIVSLLNIAAVCYGLYLLSAAYPIPGVRAGAFYVALISFFVLWALVGIGGWMTRQYSSNGAAIALCVLAVAVFAGIAWIFTRAAIVGLMERHQANGWFSWASFKGNQGLKVRRGTIVGVLAIGLTGVYSMVHSRILGGDGDPNWTWKVPFTYELVEPEEAPQKSASKKKEEESKTRDDERREPTEYHYVPIVYNAPVVIPILLAFGLIWFAYRLVNHPSFGDFLIATEAEMNKVSWTTRRRLIQDTIVVLVTMFLFTVFLFALDIGWVWSLHKVGVLVKDTNQEKNIQRQKTKW